MACYKHMYDLEAYLAEDSYTNCFSDFYVVHSLDWTQAWILIVTWWQNVSVPGLGGYFCHSSPYDAPFGFVTKTVLIHAKVLAVAEQCLCSDKAFYIYYSVPLVVRGWAKSLYVMQLVWLVQINQREIPYQMMSSSAIKLREFSQELPLLGN